MTPHPVPPRTTAHTLSVAEGWAVAWMLDVTAVRSRAAGYTAAAQDFEAGARAFRVAVADDGCPSIELTDATIENLTSMVWSLLDEWGSDTGGMERIAALEWARIGDQLLAGDESCAAMTRFMTACPTPETLPAFTASVIARLRERAGIESDLVA